jgi:sulfite exporter TauE/SafE
MVYAALATALAAATPWHAALTMTAFGVGTVPALAGLSLGVAHIPVAWRYRWARAAPIALALVGVLLVGRGLLSQPAPQSPIAAAHAHQQ